MPDQIEPAADEADGVGDVHVDNIADAEVNPNKLSPDQYQALKKSIEMFGFVQPVLLRQKNPGDLIHLEVVDGHNRVKAARELGIEFVPAVVRQWDDSSAKMAAVTLNRIRGRLDLATVADIFTEVLQDSGTAWNEEMLSVSGFSTDEVTELLEMAGEESAEDVLAGGDASMPEDEAPETKPFELVFEFTDKATFQRVKRVLRRAAGKGNELVEGLIKLTAAEED